MEKDGAVPPIRFDRRFDKPPQRKRQRPKKREEEAEQAEQDINDRSRPEDPDKPSTIDITI